MRHGLTGGRPFGLAFADDVSNRSKLRQLGSLGFEMTVDDFVKVLTAVTPFVSALIWPVLIGLVLFSFRDGLTLFFKSIAEIKLKNSIGEVSLTRIQGQVAAALSAASVDPTSQSKENATESTQRAISTAENTITSEVINRARMANVLWVDDYPRNNSFLIQAFRSIGVNVQTVLSTDEALTRLERENFDLVISDLGRAGDDMAGRTLLLRMKELKIQKPYIIYASKRALSVRDEMRNLGAIECTNDANVLFYLVIKQTTGE